MIKLRTVLFYSLSALFAVPFLLLFPGILFPRVFTLTVTGMFLRLQLVLLRVVCGIRYEVCGREHLPDGPCLIASQHESSWETLFFQILLDAPVMFAKKEVFHYPLLGTLSRKIGHIPVDRQGSVDAMREGFRVGRDVVHSGRKLLIFPTGTRRVNTDDPVVIQSGVGVLYQLAATPVVPILLNSGSCWPSGTLLKYPGTITVRILPPIASGLGRREFLEQLKADLNETP